MASLLYVPIDAREVRSKPRHPTQAFRPPSTSPDHLAGHPAQAGLFCTLPRVLLCYYPSLPTPPLLELSPSGNMVPGHEPRWDRQKLRGRERVQEQAPCTGILGASAGPPELGRGEPGAGGWEASLYMATPLTGYSWCLFSLGQCSGTFPSWKASCWTLQQCRVAQAAFQSSDPSGRQPLANVTFPRHRTHVPGQSLARDSPSSPVASSAG